jgi:hypothetical protein
MSESKIVFIPCEEYQIPARVAPRSALTPLEMLVLEAIREGVDLQERLEEMFGLRGRMMVDLLGDLLRKDYIAIDPETEQIRNTALSELRPVEELESPSEQEERLPVLRELISGHLLARMQGVVRLGTGLRAPPSSRFTRGVLPPEKRTHLLDTLVQALAQRHRGGDYRIRDAQLPVEGEDTGVLQVAQRFLRLVVRVGRHLDTGDLVFRVERPRELSAQVRSDIARGLARLAKELPNDPFFNQLEGYIQLQPLVSEGIQPALDLCRRVLHTLKGKSVGVSREGQARLVRARDDAVELLIQRETHRADISFLAGAGEIGARIRELIRTAQRQVVLVCPEGNDAGIQDYWSELTAALNERDVQVFVLWGAGANDKPDPRFATGLETLKEGARLGHLYFAPVSCRVQARVVIQDGERAVVGSYAFLRERSNRSHVPELAADIRMPPGVSREAIEDLLIWAQNSYSSPGDQERRTLILSWPEKNADGSPVPWRGVPPEYEVAARGTPTPPLAPAGGRTAGASEEARTAMRVWMERWEEQITTLEEWGATPISAAVAMTDDDHRLLLFRAIRHAERRLVLLSDRASLGAIDDRLLHALRQRLDETALRVVMVVGDQPGTGAALRLLQHLVQEFPDRMRIIQTASNIRGMIWDDDVLVSSAGPLGFASVYRKSEDGGFASDPAGARARGNGGPGRRGSEVGLHLQGAGVADAALRAVAAQIPQAKAALEALARLLGTQVRPLPPRVAKAADDAGLQQMLRMLEEAGDNPLARTVILRRFYDALDKRSELPWRTLRLLQLAGIPPSDLERAAAACLADPASAGQPGYKPWVSFLAERSWWGHQFAYTALLIAAEPEATAANAALPSLRTAELTVLRNVEQPFAARLGEMVAVTADAGEVECATLLALHALAEHGWLDAGAYLQGLGAEAPPAFVPAIGEVLGFWELYGRPLPLSLVTLGTRVREARAGAEEWHRALVEACEQGAGMKFRFELGNKTVDELFDRDGELDQLCRAGKAEDVGAVRAWLTRHGKTDRDINWLLDVATERAAKRLKEPGQRVDGGPRMKFLDRLRDIVRAAERWATATEALPDAEDSHLVEAAFSVGDRLVQWAAETGMELSRRQSRRDPVAPLLKLWLDYLSPLLNRTGGGRP